MSSGRPLARLALVEHRDPVGDGERFGLVVSDVDRRRAGRSDQGGDLDADAVTQIGVEVESGSSHSTIPVRATRARARATRCCSPPESSLG